MKERSPKERLLWLLELFKSGRIEIDNFCNEFHITYAHDLDYDELTPEEDALFDSLSRCAARFSSNPNDHIMYPKVYTTTEEIFDITEKIFRELKL